MGEGIITISLDRYNKLIGKETRLNVLVDYLKTKPYMATSELAVILGVSLEKEKDKDV